ncbi:MAG TPA: hypothetical protein VJL28_08565 [Gemmatimonadaceae bacterium]|nr:hypothetical protein [Gemmatimonadaceae bacterium]
MRPTYEGMVALRRALLALAASSPHQDAVAAFVSATVITGRSAHLTDEDIIELLVSYTKRVPAGKEPI